MKKNTLSPPMISVITRSCGRPEKLQANQRSLQSQTDPDFEQIIIKDTACKGYLWANTKIFQVAEKLNGRYVYVLDDDDCLINNDFIKKLKQFIEAQKKLAEVIICKGYIDFKLFPKVWREPIHRGQIGSPNFIVRNDIFAKNAIHWVKERAGDFHFISSCGSHKDFLWWDEIIFNAE